MAARVRAALRACPATATVELPVEVREGRVSLEGIVGGEAEQAAPLRIPRGAPEVVEVADGTQVFRPPVR